MTNKNVCVLCGKQRIVVSTYKETIATGVVTYTETSCPDLECQKRLVEQLKIEEQKRLEKMAQRNQKGFGYNRFNNSVIKK